MSPERCKDRLAMPFGLTSLIFSYLALCFTPVVAQTPGDGPFHVSVTATDHGVRVEVFHDRSASRTLVTVFRRHVHSRQLPDERFTRTRTFLQKLDTRWSEIVFRKRLAGGDRFVFMDNDVARNETYAYWVCSSSDSTNPVTVRVRPRDVWWGKASVDRATAAIEKDHGSVTVATYGTTTSGWPLRGIRAGNRRRTVALVGGIHAGESGPEILLPVLRRLIRNDAALLEEVGISVLPLVNADQRQRLVDGLPWYLRKNPAGVDINRNFDAQWELEGKHYGMSPTNPDHETYRGESPHSERETLAVVRFIEEIPPLVALSYHGVGSATGGAFAVPTHSDSLYDMRTREVVAAYWSGYAQGTELEGQPWVPVSGNSGPGTLPQWLCVAHNIPAADIECGSSQECTAAELDRITVPQLEALHLRHYNALKSLLVFLASSNR